MKELLVKIQNYKSEIENLDSISKENQKILWDKFRLEWNYNSNHIEGNTLTFAQTKALFHFGDDYKPENNTLREINEMQGHDLAIQHLQTLIDDSSRPLTTTDVCELNETILVKPYYSDAITTSGLEVRKKIIPGKYKTQPNHVQLPNGEIFKYAEVHEVAAKMDDLLQWYRDEKQLDIISKAALFHYEFVLIHPFDDGNGRVSRLLMNYHFMKNGYPPVVIKSEDKKNYLYALQQADLGNIEAFIKYIGEQLVWSMEISLKATKGEAIEESGDLDKKIELLSKKLGQHKPSTPIRTKDGALALYRNTIMELFSSIKTELSNIFNLFSSHQTSITVNNIGQGFELNNANLIPKNLKQDDEIEKFILSIDCHNLLKGNSSKKGHIHKKVVVNLDLYNYHIKLNNERRIEHSYDELFSKYEMEIIGREVKESLFNMVQKEDKS